MKYGDLISIVVPVYNRAHLIGRSVGSLCAQSYRNIEILVVDDCSTDDLSTAVSAFADPRIRLIRRAENGGAAAARNTGAGEAAAEWVAFHDSDDICVFDRIERQARKLLALPQDYIGVHCSRLLYLETTEATYHRALGFVLPKPDRAGDLSGNLYHPTIRGNYISVPTMLLRKSAIAAAGGFDEGLRNNEDWDFTLRLTRLGKFGFLPEPLYLTLLQVAHESTEAQISTNERYSARSFITITGKLRRAGVAPKELAAHYMVTGRLLLRENRPALARRYLGASLRGRPRKLRTLTLYAVSFAPWLYPLARKLFGRNLNKPI